MKRKADLSVIITRNETQVAADADRESLRTKAH